MCGGIVPHLNLGTRQR